MNIFTKVAIEQEIIPYITLGNPLGELANARVSTFSVMTKGKGFKQLAKEPERYNDKGERDPKGKTRGERKRIARTAANERVSEKRTREYNHRYLLREAQGEVF